MSIVDAQTNIKIFKLYTNEAQKENHQSKLPLFLLIIAIFSKNSTNYYPTNLIEQKHTNIEITEPGINLQTLESEDASSPGADWEIKTLTKGRFRRKGTHRHRRGCQCCRFGASWSSSRGAPRSTPSPVGSYARGTCASRTSSTTSSSPSSSSSSSSSRLRCAISPSSDRS